MKPTKLFFAFLLCTLCSLRLWATGIDIGNDRIVIVGTTVGIHANITINGLRDEEFPIKWYKRTYNETNYTLFAEGTGATDVTLSPTETTYVKATVTDAVQVFCEDVLVLIVPSVTVAEVSFLNTQGNVRQDPTPSNNAPDYFTAPHWNSSDNPTLKNPVLYKGNDKIKLSFKLNLIANGSEQPLTPSTLMSDFVQNIRIKCNAGIEGQAPIYLLPSTSVTQNGSILESATDVEASTAFAAQVGFYDPMAFAWIISYTAGTSWETNPISTTLNRVYVTATLPILDATQRYLTTVHLSCKNAATYSTHWFKEGVGPEIGNTLNIYHLTPGNYTLHMSRAGWCSPAKYNYTIPSATNMGIQIYPNPATNQLTVSGHPTTGKHYLTLHDVTGRTVLQQLLQTGDTNLSIVHLPTGLYVYEIRNEQNELLGADKLTIIR